jgi:hypothetical protein
MMIISGPKIEEVTGDRKFYNEEVQHFYSSSNIIRVTDPLACNLFFCISPAECTSQNFSSIITSL